MVVAPEYGVPGMLEVVQDVDKRSGWCDIGDGRTGQGWAMPLVIRLPDDDVDGMSEVDIPAHCHPSSFSVTVGLAVRGFWLENMVRHAKNDEVHRLHRQLTLFQNIACRWMVEDANTDT